MLKDISSSVQQVAEAISIAISVEVEIVDQHLTIVGGTGVYANKIGEKEESGEVDGNYLYARVLRTGNSEVVEDAVNTANYGASAGKSTELAEVCTPIKIDNDIIGIIGLVAFDESQKAILLDKSKNMVTFVEKMADLLAAKAAKNEALNNVKVSMNELSTVLETAHEGIFAIDNKGYITQCNNEAEKLLHTERMEIIGSHLSKYMLGSPAFDVLKTGTGYTESEEVYKNEKRNLHFIVTVKAFFNEDIVAGAVVSFRDIEEAKKLAYNMNTNTLKYTFDDIIGESESIRKTKSQALMTARGSSTILITGESGTGKEMFAKAIHYASPRAKRPFVTVNCGAIPENLLESELFGYEKGAFTGASEKGKVGKFEQANGGTIFLDEIGDMPLHLQVKILHAIQNMRFERVGGFKTILVDVRVIAATNKNLEEMIIEGTFREDLYYRLNVIPLSTPPLKERTDDVKVLMYYFLNKYNVFMGKHISGFTDEVETVFSSYEWPGNVRELENAVEYGVNMAFGDKIGLDAIPLRLLKSDITTPILDIRDNGMTLSEQVRIFEREIISRKLNQHAKTGHAKESTAKELGLSRATLYRKLAEFDL